MLLNDVSAKDIAKMAPPSTPSQVHGVIRGDRPTAYIRKVIAKAINKTVCEIWPV